jgi:hypothetical protein
VNNASVTEPGVLIAGTGVTERSRGKTTPSGVRYFMITSVLRMGAKTLTSDLTTQCRKIKKPQIKYMIMSFMLPSISFTHFPPSKTPPFVSLTMRIPFDDARKILFEKLGLPDKTSNKLADGPAIASDMLLHNMVDMQEKVERAEKDLQDAERERKAANAQLNEIKERLLRCICGQPRVHDISNIGTGLSVPPAHYLRRTRSSIFESTALRA